MWHLVLTIWAEVQPVMQLARIGKIGRETYPTISKHSYFLVRDIVRPIPTSRVHSLARELVYALDLWPLWNIELTDSANEKVACDGILGLILCFLA